MLMKYNIGTMKITRYKSCRLQSYDHKHAYLTQNIFWHRCFFKGHYRFGNIIALDSNLVGSSPIVSFLFGPFLDVRMFHVKVLFEGNKCFFREIDVMQIRS